MEKDSEIDNKSMLHPLRLESGVGMFAHRFRTMLLIFLLLDLVIINYKLFFAEQTKGTIVKSESSHTVNVADTPFACPSLCMDAIKSATSSSEKRFDTPKSNAVNTAQELFISLGSGSNLTDEWTDVTGVQAYIDSSKYKIDQAFFEVSIYIPTGNQTAYVRLYNVTDKHPVWFSDVSLDGGLPKFLISSPIQLDSGNKLYQVQMKSTLKFKTNLIESRVRIVTK